MTTAAKLVSVARSQIGTREGRSSNGTWNNRIKYNDWYVSVTKNEAFRNAAWCEIFVSWCARQAGIPTDVIPNSAYTPAGLNWYKARKRQVSVPQAGDIGYVFYPAIGMVGHVFIVERREGNDVITIEGNTNTSGSSQGNGVYRLRRPISSRLRFVRPAYKAVSAASIPQPAKPPADVKLLNRVSVAHLKEARMTDPQQEGTPRGKWKNEVYTLETALVRTEWMKPESADGHYGTDTVGDGSSGFGGVTGFQKKHSQASFPDGWMGKEELKLLFKLAGMNVQVTA